MLRVCTHEMHVLLPDASLAYTEKYARNMQEICKKYARNMQEICYSGFLLSVKLTCLRVCTDFSASRAQQGGDILCCVGGAWHFTTQFTCFTSIKVQILTPEELQDLLQDSYNANKSNASASELDDLVSEMPHRVGLWAMKMQKKNAKKIVRSELRKALRFRTRIQ